jgi:hypothetical protein
MLRSSPGKLGEKPIEQLLVTCDTPQLRKATGNAKASLRDCGKADKKYSDNPVAPAAIAATLPIASQPHRILRLKAKRQIQPTGISFPPLLGDGKIWRSE